MSRSLVLFAVVVLVVVGGLFVLSGRDGTQPQTRVEKVVPLANLSN